MRPYYFSIQNLGLLDENCQLYSGISFHQKKKKSKHIIHPADVVALRKDNKHPGNYFVIKYYCYHHQQKVFFFFFLCLALIQVYIYSRLRIERELCVIY